MHIKRYGLSDFNLLDWSCDGVVGVALGGSAYLWTNDPPDTHLLMQTFGNNSCITSLAFDRAGHRIAVGTSHSQLQVHGFVKTLKF